MVTHRTKIWGAWHLLAYLHAKIAVGIAVGRRTLEKCDREPRFVTHLFFISCNLMRKRISSCGLVVNVNDYKTRLALHIRARTQENPGADGSCRLLTSDCFLFTLSLCGKTSQARQHEHTLWFARGREFSVFFCLLKHPSHHTTAVNAPPTGTRQPSKPEKRRLAAI